MIRKKYNFTMGKATATKPNVLSCKERYNNIHDVSIY